MNPLYKLVDIDVKELEVEHTAFMKRLKTGTLTSMTDEQFCNEDNPFVRVYIQCHDDWALVQYLNRFENTYDDWLIIPEVIIALLIDSIVEGRYIADIGYCIRVKEEWR